MVHSLCIIDDGFMIPARSLNIERHKYFSDSTIDIFLKSSWGIENALKDLCRAIVDDESDDGRRRWNLLAFTNPAFFLNSFTDQNIRTDIIVFDWEYSTLPHFDQVAFLRNIFKITHAYVFIFSGADKEEEINAIIANDLIEYQSRVQLLTKENHEQNGDSHTRLHNLISEKQSTNFSFKFGKELRKITNQSLDNVLLHLSEMNIEKVIECLGANGATPIDSDLKELIGTKINNHLKESQTLHIFLKAKHIIPQKICELIDFISDKVKNDIIECSLPHQPAATPAPTPNPTPAQQNENLILMEKIWSYRLYHKPNDQFVRTGDIIQANADHDELFLVITPICDLGRFWSKTNGELNLVSLMDTELKREYIRSIASEVKSLGGINPIPTSFTNNLKEIPGSPLLIPFIDINGAKRNYLAFPKKITTISVPIPANFQAKTKKEKANHSLEYDHIAYTHICTVSQPFLSPLIDNLASSLLGAGSPDYNSALQPTLSSKVKEIFNDQT